MKSKKSSVKKKLFTALAVFSVLTLILMAVLQLFFFPFIYRYIRIYELKNTAKEISEDYGESDFYSKTKNTVDKKNIAAAVINLDSGQLSNLSGRILPGCILYSLSSQDCLNIYGYLKDYGDGSLLLYQKDADSLSFNSTKNLYDLNTKNVLYVLEFSRGETNYMALVNAYIEPLGSVTRTIGITLGTIGLFMIGMTVILGWFLSRKITKPIIKINASAKNLGSAEKTVFDENLGYREANELSATLNKASAELSKTESLRKELVANVSHDLRTPLTLIKGYTEVMRDIPGQATQENLNIVIDETDRLTSLVDDILSISKIQSGNVELDKEDFSITTEVSSLVANYSAMTKNLGYTFFFDSDSDATVNADKKLILEAVVNLINNAMTHSGDKKAVLVRQKTNGKYVRIEVSDKGPGIPPDQLDLIWDRYYKVDKEHRRQENGSGLGLSIVKSIVTLHKGNYGVRSREGENSGSTFWIELEKKQP